jgi:Ca-activated chloride channel homolog
MTLITFTKPTYLILLALIPLIIFIHFYTLRRRRSVALRFANFEAISRVKGVDILSKNIVILILTSIIAVSLILALAGTTYHRTLYSSAFSFGIALDSSRSMEADDFFPTRHEAAKETAINFVENSATGTKMSITSFSGNAFIEQSITDDKSILKQAIRNIPISSVGGTDLGEAVITSTNLLKGEESKAIILISDGRINIGTLDLSINYANENDVIVHSIGMGTVEGGTTSYGSLSKIDEDALKAIAHNTGGQYFNALNKDLLLTSFDSIMGLRLGKVSLDLSPYLTILALVLFIIEYILTNTRYKIFP